MYNDIRSGVVILAMAVYWIVFIGEHTEVGLFSFSCTGKDSGPLLCVYELSAYSTWHMAYWIVFPVL